MPPRHRQPFTPRTPRESVGTLGTTLAVPTEFDPGDLFNPMFGAIEGAVNRLIRGSRGVNEEALIAAAFKELPDEIALKDARATIAFVLNDMASKDKVVRIRFTSEGSTYTHYFPGNTTLEVTPWNSRLTPTEQAETLPQLSDESKRVAQSYITNLSWVAGQSPDIVTHILDAFCPRCGVPAKGHICTPQTPAGLESKV